ncbi:MAG: M56 family metallopeptidase, partial [Planctomycetaceae bacterium]|nr:M56 family metallopeptidase [Planctomycetaceae bacterium]
MTTIILYSLLRTTLVLTLCGGVCFLALRKVEHRLLKLSRLLWVAVLLTGWFWLQPAIRIPVRETADGRQQTADGSISTSLPPYHIWEESGKRERYISVQSDAKASETSPLPSSSTICCLLSFLWLTGMLTMTFLAATGYIRILLSLRKAKPADDDDTVAGSLVWKKLLTEHGIAPKTVPMVLSQNLGPALILTPLGYRLAVHEELWSELSETGRLGILKHELAHFRRRDFWKSLFVRILTLPHWFNPVAHYAANRFDELAEQLCDREAFSGKQEDTSEFARILLLLHENAPTHFVVRQSFFGRNLKRRIALLTENPLTERKFTMRKTLLVLGTAVILFAALFRFEFVAPAKEPGTFNPGAYAPGTLVASESPEQIELRLTVTDEEKRPLAGAQVELIYGADNLYSLRFETGADGVGITKIPVAAANTATQGWVRCREKGMTSNFSLWNIPKDWEPSKPLEMSIPVYKRTRVLTGTVVDSDDKPVAGAWVGDSFEKFFSQTDAEGKFEYYFSNRPMETLFAFKEGVGGAAISPDYENHADQW